MSETIQEHAGVLVVLRCWCGVQHAVPQSLRNEQLRMHECGEKMSIHCPLGHKHVPGGESEADKIRRQLAAERARHDQTRAALGQAERCLIAEKGAKTKLKKRIANGMCPCCKRSFQNLGRHMKTQHPQYTRDADA